MTKRNYYRKFILGLNFQFLIGALLLIFFNGVIYILKYFDLFELSVSVDSLINFLSTLASIIGIIGAVIFGYFFFSFQTIAAQQQNWHLAIKSEINNLLNVLHELPPEFNYLIEPLNKCIDFLQDKRMGDYPIVGDDWKPIHRPVEIAATNEIIGYPIINNMVNSLSKIEEFASEIGVTKIAIICAIFILRSIYKLFYLLLLIIGTIFLFYIIRDKYVVNSFVNSSLMFMFLYFVCLSIFEVIIHLSDYYRDIMPEIENKTNGN